MNLKAYKSYPMVGIYKYASLIEECVSHSIGFDEIDWNADEVKRSLGKPNKISLLHHYIFRVIGVEEFRDYRKNPDRYEVEEPFQEIESLFELYKIPIRSYEEFISDKSEDEWQMYNWACDQEEHFVNLFQNITEEVHRLLFGNRNFLLDFNNGLAEFLKDNSDIIPQELKSETGKISRSSIPTWVKNAVYFRDHGRCIFCAKDLTGLLSTDKKLHYDHIVPLHRFGTNDSSNFQLACEACNLVKSGSEGRTDCRYISWWV